MMKNKQDNGEFSGQIFLILILPTNALFFVVTYHYTQKTFSSKKQATVLVLSHGNFFKL